MPYLRIQTNKGIDDTMTQDMLKKASRLVAQQLSKPEKYVMVSFEPSNAMLFAGSAEPAAFLELRAIGFPADRTDDLSRLLCELVQSELDIPKDRVFINFADVPPNRWGWNGETF
ncbi:MAG TPA: phenylpyruvate tautomerase MIF-related protein [Verrucomicrobiae bacterium]|nr:phenylpyruvate tautomerase MIF-related protein [Verrucomicrobiae bacterium]